MGIRDFMLDSHYFHVPHLKFRIGYTSISSVAAADGCSSPGGRVPVRVVRGPGDG